MLGVRSVSRGESEPKQQREDLPVVTWKRALLLTSAWFGFGLGLARTAPVAHACTCLQTAYWELELKSIDDVSESGVSGDIAREQAYWPAEAGFTGKSLLLGNGHYVGVRRVP